MRRLILLRHGEAEPQGAGSDADRALTDTGRRQAAAMSLLLADLGFAPDLALVSPAKRTQQTWSAAKDALGGATMRTEKDLLHGSAPSLLRLAQEQEALTVLLVAHNPSLAELADALSQRAPAGVARQRLGLFGFSPATAAVFSLDDDEGWSFDAFLRPKDAA